MLTLLFWKATAERAVRTAAQGVLASITADQLGILDVNWGQAGSIGGLAAVLAVLTAIATSGGAEGPGITETVRRRPSALPRL
ncbi:MULTISPECIES: holin [unclassified Streptomyces]|uniref:holin n=1 Tax=unclassified Streptomyces TaxID=2593676 RepID=UPI00226D8B77|nr:MULTISPECIES: holin [unclassified Streptomyces]MCY0919596.1 holin [Streptomyces sp. H27-G5]MCY0959652.1 holin [Streptomyces sp. H27-H5]